MSKYKTLVSIPLSQVKTLNVNEVVEPLELDSPATFVMTDFSRRSPRIIDGDTSIDETINIMNKIHVRSKLVVDKHLSLIGIVNLADLMSRKVLMTANQKGVKRSEIALTDVMVKVSDLHAVKLQKVQGSSIGDILATMRNLGEQHLLVYDNDKHIRGVISAVDIGRALRIPLDINATAHSFKDVFNVIHEHTELG
ncbi:MAG: CBS domain-containing protein [Paraglaciecola sp.]|uniref:CBS domain-containing protein n=1 Tax=Pseudomonadati TaxID=3379134 RepID=UPI00273FCB46|nr:CBS domain-containing protein [Paraglaciecola sp.]MDP5032749.1 CBS domain-containing protein [Paraglaciecola sp.]MDP5130553.1 CBS domain-containing protein [Paraglaciecola sp.]